MEVEQIRPNYRANQASVNLVASLCGLVGVRLAGVLRHVRVDVANEIRTKRRRENRPCGTERFFWRIKMFLFFVFDSVEQMSVHLHLSVAHWCNRVLTEATCVLFVDNQTELHPYAERSIEQPLTKNANNIHVSP